MYVICVFWALYMRLLFLLIDFIHYNDLPCCAWFTSYICSFHYNLCVYYFVLIPLVSCVLFACCLRILVVLCCVVVWLCGCCVLCCVRVLCILRVCVLRMCWACCVLLVIYYTTHA